MAKSRAITRASDAKRYAENEWRAWYLLPIWRHPIKGLRARQLAEHPLCERHLARGLVVAANTVHHRKAHRGEWALFSNANNLESLCKSCHDGEATREERGSPAILPVTKEGWPEG